MRFGYHANAWGGVVGHPVGVTSIKDLFYLTPGDTIDTIGRVAAAGWSGIELFDGNLAEFADRPEELTGALERHGVELVGVYSGANLIFADVLEEELWRVDRACELGRRFGASQFVIGGGAQRTRPADDADYEALASALDTVAGIAERHGLTPTFHPHLSTIVEGPEQVDAVFSRSRIGFCPDLAHLHAGGCDVVDLVRRYADRIPYIHFKDVDAAGGFVPLGRGVIDLAGVAQALRDAGYDGWVLVELDGYDGDPDAAARDNLSVLRELLGEPASTT